MLDVNAGSDNGGVAARCDGLSRRRFVRLGALSALGLSLPELLQIEAAQAQALKDGPKPGTSSAPRSFGRAKNVLLIYLGGGLTHHDTLDPKPDAPEDIRGKYGTIATKISGVRFTDKMPELAKINDTFALCRGQVTGSDHHETAAQWMLTGNYGNMQGGDYPAIGAIAAHESKTIPGMPPYVAIPRNHSFTWELGKAAWLGERYESFKTGDCQDKDWRVPNLAPLPDVPSERLARRTNILRAIDDVARHVEGSDELASMDAFYKRAVQMILSPRARDAFDLNKESDAVREEYGGKNDRWGAQALLARRLIEADVRFVLLSYNNWDMHGKIFEGCDRDLPGFDRAVAALLRDMKRRGLLENTLVAMYGDFGRASKINKDAGRDHWGNAGVLLFAGAGVLPGQVIGKTDTRGEYVVERPVRPPEVAATIYHALGIDYERALMSPTGRPVAILPECEPIHELWSGGGTGTA